MNKDDQELFGIVNSTNVVPKRDFILMMIDNAGFTEEKMVARLKPFIDGKMQHYGFFKVDEVSKYYLVWGSSKMLTDPGESDGDVIKARTRKELEHLLKISELHENEDYFENYLEVPFRGEVYLYCPTIEDSILMSIFNLDVERNIAKRYSSIQTAAEFFSILDKTVLGSSPNKWNEGMLFKHQFKFLKKQLKSKCKLRSYQDKGK